MTLVDMRSGGSAMILTLPEDSELRSQCIRLGLCVGVSVTCMQRLPGGTIVLETNRQEIAIGRSLAVRIGISHGDTATAGS